MSKLIIALATAASALASVALEIAQAHGAEPQDTQEPSDSTDKPKRGRPAKTPEKEPAAPEGKTYEELMELIRPIVEDNKGEAVKKLIAKHVGGEGGLQKMATMPHVQAAFEKDLQALAF